MKASYDFSNAKRGPVVAEPGKTRITIWIDDDVLASFRDRAATQGKGYQTLINEALRVAAHERSEPPLTLSALRRVLREEMRA